MPRPQQQADGLGRHDRKVLWGREVRDAEGVPQDDVGIVDAGVAVGDPLRETQGGIARRLRDVSAGRVDLVVVVFLVWMSAFLLLQAIESRGIVGIETNIW